MKVWESPFIPSHLTFKRFRIHSLSVNQSNNQSNLSVYYNIPKFRILGCYKPTTLKMNLVLEIRRGQKEIGQGLGSSQNPLINTGGLGCYHPQKHGYGSIQTHILHPLFLTVSVLSNPRENSFSELFRQWHNLFLNSSVLSSW